MSSSSYKATMYWSRNEDNANQASWVVWSFLTHNQP